VPSLCETAPAHNAQKNDPGFFGAGIYFTPQASYAILYAAEGVAVTGTTSTPNELGEFTLLYCWVAIGNLYPVTRDDYVTDQCVFYGKPLKPGFDAHCVCVDSKLGFQATTSIKAIKENNARIFDEVVVGASAQVLPQCVVYFKRVQNS